MKILLNLWKPFPTSKIILIFLFIHKVVEGALFHWNLYISIVKAVHAMPGQNFVSLRQHKAGWLRHLLNSIDAYCQSV